MMESDSPPPYQASPEYPPAANPGGYPAATHPLAQQPHPGGGGMNRPPLPQRPPPHVMSDQMAVYQQGQPYPSSQQDYPYGPPQNDGQPAYQSAVPMTTENDDNGSGSGSGSGQDEHHTEGMTKFNEKSIRLGFIKKVFGILFFQLLVTAGLMCIFIFVTPVKQYLRLHRWVYITAICLTVVMLIIFAFVRKIRRVWPANLVAIIVITIVMSTMLGCVASSMRTDEVLIAVGIVTAIVMLCAILGFQKRFDFTPLVGFVAILGMCLFAFGFLNIFFYDRVLRIMYASLGALLFSLWLLLDIQLMLKGRHKISLDPEEYVSGALNLYVDIIYIFLMVFMIFKNT